MRRLGAEREVPLGPRSGADVIIVIMHVLRMRACVEREAGGKGTEEEQSWSGVRRDERATASGVEVKIPIDRLRLQSIELVPVDMTGYCRSRYTHRTAS